MTPPPPPRRCARTKGRPARRSPSSSSQARSQGPTRKLPCLRGRGQGETSTRRGDAPTRARCSWIHFHFHTGTNADMQRRSCRAYCSIAQSGARVSDNGCARAPSAGVAWLSYSCSAARQHFELRRRRRRRCRRTPDAEYGATTGSWGCRASLGPCTDRCGKGRERNRRAQLDGIQSWRP